MKRRAALLALALLTGGPACTAPAPAAAPSPPPPATTTPLPTPSAAETPDDAFWYRAPPVAAAAPFTPPRTEELRLTDGARVLLIEQHHAPVIIVVAILHLRPPPIPGLDTTLTDVLFDAADLTGWKLGERAGAWHAPVREEGVTFIPLSIAPSELDRALRTLVDGLARDPLQTNHLEALRRRALDALPKTTRDRTLGALDAWLFPTGPAHDQAVGLEAGLRKLTVRDLERYRDVALDPAAVGWSVVGDVTPQALRDALERATAGWKPLRSLPAAPASRPPRGSLLVQEPELAEAHVVIVAPSPTFVGADVAAVTAEYLLVQPLHDRMARHYEKLVGEPAGIHIDLSIRGGVPLLCTELNVRGASVPAAARAYLDALDEIARDGLPADEAERTRRLSIAQQEGDFAGAMNLATVLGWPLAVGNAADWPAARYRATLTVKPDDIRRAAAAHLRPGDMHLVALGDVAGLKGDLERLKLGPVTVEKPPAPKK